MSTLVPRFGSHREMTKSQVSKSQSTPRLQIPNPTTGFARFSPIRFWRFFGFKPWDLRFDWVLSPWGLVMRSLHPVAVLGVLLLAGCGYQQTGVENANVTPGYKWHSLYREDIQTVAVPVFKNETYQRGLEMELTKSIVQEMEEHTPYKVVPEDRADTELDGEIIFAATNTLSEDSNTGLPQEQLYTIIVNFTWKNLRTGHILVERKKFDERTSFFPTLGEPQSVGSTTAIGELARSVVQELQADW
jgi:hypothetical protein